MEELWSDYLEWLLYRVGIGKRSKWKKLFNELHNIPFTWSMERDDNRAEDGKSLRDRYEIPFKYIYFEDEFVHRDCSVLEMLVALAIRVENEYIGDPNEDENPSRFFMDMLSNLGLLRFEDTFFVKSSVDYIRKYVRKWLERGFKPDGFGSPFPVRKDRRDQRCLEIWDQMISYINENY